MNPTRTPSDTDHRLAAVVCLGMAGCLVLIAARPSTSTANLLEVPLLTASVPLLLFRSITVRLGVVTFGTIVGWALIGILVPILIPQRPETGPHINVGLQSQSRANFVATMVVVGFTCAYLPASNSDPFAPIVRATEADALGQGRARRRLTDSGQ
jgi:hypothetical protein